MNPIQSTYIINKHTYALLPAKAIDFDTIVLEKNKTLYIQQTPMTIIDNSCCLLGCSTYQGRRNAVILQTNFYQKVPIPISIQQQIYFFPTHSIKHMDNYWLSYPNIQCIHRAGNPQTIVQFRNGQRLKVHASKHTIQSQMNRTFQVMYEMEHKNIHMFMLNSHELV